jgi:tripartite-type tricarboxylate transporter receptor subunit TctC
LPTIAEAGLPGYDAGLWFGIMAPAGTPQPLIDKLSRAANAALKDAEVLKELHVQGLDALGGSPEEFGVFIKSETERWARIIKQMDLVKEK